ncbi:MAG: DUF3368 domain-containing protein [Planctomycetota bacterium]
MKVVSNSSVLIALGGIGRLGILPAKFGQVYVPPAVWREVVEEGSGRPGGAEVARAVWIARTDLSDPSLALSLRSRLDDGEADALALAKEVGADRVLIDERSARASAKAIGLVLLGTLGILILGKRNGLVPSLKAETDRLLAFGFRIDPAILQRALTAAGE